MQVKTVHKFQILLIIQFLKQIYRLIDFSYD
jgi:hypothetical protein